MLWIDFKLYFYVSNHKYGLHLHLPAHVVNWFQIVFLREQSQGVVNIQREVGGCELISNCIFTWAITSFSKTYSKVTMLWIDFKLYFYVSNHKTPRIRVFGGQVVNWFQIVFLREQSQGRTEKELHICCCELISNCIFTWAITSNFGFRFV